MNQPPYPPPGPPGQPPAWGPPPGPQGPYGQVGYAARPPTSTLAIVALVLSFLCIPPVGLVLAIIALVRISRSQGALGGQVLAIIALAVNLLFVPGAVGMVAAIAIPNFVKFQCLSKQSEAKTNLKSLYIAEESFRAEHNRYTPSADEAGWTPQGTIFRYEYAIVSASETSFIAEAYGRGEMEGDLWRINEQNEIENVANACD